MTMERDKAQLRCAMYTRVSTEDQAREGFSLRAQEARLRAYAGARGVPTKRNGRWSKRQIFRILHSPLYRGARRWEDVVTQNAHEPILRPAGRARRRRWTERRRGA